MRLLSTAVLLFLFYSLTFAQEKKLPDILIPDAASKAVAERMGAKVFKLLPSGMFYEWPWPDKEEDFKIGIRGGGSYFSFISGSHSYGSDMQIQLLGSRLTVVSDLGFFADLGRRDLSTIDATSAEAEFFRSYKPPTYLKEISGEGEKLYNGENGMLTLTSIIQWKAQSSYLLRLIRFEKSDILVAFQIIRADKNGALTIVWKKINELPLPFVLYASDDDLWQQIEVVRVKENIHCSDFVVKDNILIFLTFNENNRSLQNALNRYGIRRRYDHPELRQ